MRARSKTNNKVVLVALAANLAIALTKFVAAAITGSAAMLSEGVHSLVDTIDEILLMYGLKRASKPPDKMRPFGYGRELYFWSFIVALLVLALGTGASVYQGVARLLNPAPIQSPSLNYAVLAASFLFEGSSWLYTLRAFREAKGEQTYFNAFRTSKDPSTFIVLFEDTAALIGLVIAFAGIAGAQVFGIPQLDAIASFAIGLVLAASSLLLARETKALLIGEPARPHVRQSILQIAGADPGVRTANGVLTTQIGPHQIVAALSAEFEDTLTTTEIESCVNRIEAAIKAAHPDVSILFIKPQTAQMWQRRLQRIENAAESGS